MLIAMRRRKRAMNYLCEPAIMPTTSGRVFRHNLLSQRRLIQTKISPTANHKHAQIPEDNSKFILFALPTWVLQMYFQESFLHSPYSLTHPPNTQHKHTAADVCLPNLVIVFRIEPQQGKQTQLLTQHQCERLSLQPGQRWGGGKGRRPPNLGLPH